MKASTKWILLFILVLLVVFPLLFVKYGEFGGADGMAEEMITAINPDYEPWFSSVLEPVSGEVESLLFALQAAIGSGVISFYFGYKRGRKCNVKN